MISRSHDPDSATSSIVYDRRAPSVHVLAPIVVWCLSQADIPPVATAIAPLEERITYETSAGRISVVTPENEISDRVVLRAEGAGSYEMAHQICFQLTSRILERTDAVEIFWGNTWQHMKAEAFGWSALQDIPQVKGGCRVPVVFAALSNLA